MADEMEFDEIDETARPREDRAPLAPILNGETPTRKRGRPPGSGRKATVASTPIDETDELVDLNGVEASNLDYDSWIQRFPWETGQYGCKVKRQAPTKYSIGNGRHIEIAGLLAEQDAPFTELELGQIFGGKTLQVIIVGPDPKSGKVRALSNRQVIVGGEPRLAEDSMPYEMWERIRPILAEAGKLKDETTEEEPIFTPRRSTFRQPPYDYPSRDDYNPRRFTAPQGEANVSTLKMLKEGFSDAAKQAQTMAETSIREKDSIIVSQRELLNVERERLLAEAATARSDAREVREQLEAERKEAAKALELLQLRLEKVISEQHTNTLQLRQSFEQAANRREEELRRDSQTREQAAVTSGNELLKLLLPMQQNSAEQRVTSLTQSYESRINTLDSSYKLLLDAERTKADAHARSVETLYTNQINLITNTLTQEINNLKQRFDLETAERIRLQRELDEAHKRSVEDLNRSMTMQLELSNPQRQLQSTQSLISVLNEMRNSTSNGEHNPEDTSIVGKIVNMLERTAPEVARAIATRPQMQVVQQQQPRQLMQMPQQMVEAQQIVQPVAMPHIVQNPPQAAKPPRVSSGVSKNELQAALANLAEVYKSNSSPTEAQIQDFATYITTTQKPELITLIKRVKITGFISKLQQDALIPVEINNEQGIGFLTQLLTAIKKM